MVQIRKARRSATKLRLLLTGPSGSGKTWGALQIAKGIGGKCVVIDTEEGSSDLYDHLHDFDVIDLRPPFSPERYIEAITAAEQAGYEVIVVDSVTHCWSGPGGCLEILEDVAKAQFRGNTWSAFSVITPRWRAFVDKLLRSPAHIICSGRSKTETAQVDDHGKKKVAKLGMKLEARDGLEFEFTCVLDLIHDGHYATVSKDRTGLFAGDPKPITVATGERLAGWLAGGHAVEQQKPTREPVVVRPKFPSTESRPAAVERGHAPATAVDSHAQQTAQPPATPANEDAMQRSRLAVNRAKTVAELQRFRSITEERLKAGAYTPAQADELFNIISHKLDWLTSEDGGQEFTHEAAEHEVQA